jgi:hypothetical protein
MTDFTKTKMHFALALLGTLFALHQILDKWQDVGFTYLGYKIEIIHVYGVIGGLLALTVYCFAVGLLSERSSPRAEKVGNYLYALAILILPLYGLLYLSNLLAQQLGEEHWAYTAPTTVALSLGIGWLLLSQVLAWRLRDRLGDQDRQAKLEQFVDQEITALDHAPELFGASHYDLAVIEAWKAIEARLRRVLLMRGYTRRLDTEQKLVDTAVRAGILKESTRKLLDEVRLEWKIAVGTEPLSREAAEKALQTTRQILATIPVEHSNQTSKPAA